MTIDLRKKIIRFSLLILAIIGLMLIVIIPPIMTEVVWINEGVLRTNNHASEIVLMVVVPFLMSSNLFCISTFYKSFTKDDAKQQIELQHRYGLIDDENYYNNLKHLELYEFKKRKDRALIELEKTKFLQELEREKNKIYKKDVKKDECSN